ncbi:hypothetical protein C2845_PM05G16690 [Panicum miliaceum]|uniref:Uncharacterized protein n=1 Tax=Panicum miliaceum TaxID=4540 RepID=A0A3L6SWY9_PANMI|nr:hypothetical protein C2845_PM05G16690 [Panicum miliaceum]
MEGEVDLGDLYGAAAGWVEARTSCPHLGTIAARRCRRPSARAPARLSVLEVWITSLLLEFSAEPWNPHSSIFVNNDVITLLKTGYA